MDYVVPRTLSKFGERAFAYAEPAAWNRLPNPKQGALHVRFMYVMRCRRYVSAFPHLTIITNIEVRLQV